MNQRTPAEDAHPSSVGRYLLHEPIAWGGMATVYAARLIAAEGVTRIVAAKRLHPQYLYDPELVAMFHDEARIASRIHHPNVVPVLDLVHDGEEVIIVQEYVHGVPLSQLLKRAVAERQPISLAIVLAVVSGILSGLHAAHEVTDTVGEPLHVVHRDVSPQNVLVSADGVPRVVDFGIAKARTSMVQTREGVFKGKLSYMAPEQLRGDPVTRATDIYAAGVLLWELIVNRRFHDGTNDLDFVQAVALGATMTPTQALLSSREPISAELRAQVGLLEPIIRRAMALSPAARYGTAEEMAAALRTVARNASTSEVATWVRAAGAEHLHERRRILLAAEERAIPLDRAPRTSGARMRISVQGPDESPGPWRGIEALRPTVPNLPSAPPQAQKGGQRSRILLPWVLCALLFVAVCVLAAITISGRGRAHPAERVPITTRHVEVPAPPAAGL